MTVTEKRDLIEMIDRWMNTGGRAPNEVENERRKCAKELNRWLRHKDRVVLDPAPPPSATAAPAEEEKCPECNGTALVLNNQGEPDDCRDCINGRAPGPERSKT